jgi:hypothetical protein
MRDPASTRVALEARSLFFIFRAKKNGTNPLFAANPGLRLSYHISRAGTTGKTDSEVRARANAE